MASRVFESLTCWPNIEHIQPAIIVTLSTLEGRRVIHNEKLPVDTGFAGAMLLSRNTFSHFEKAELPESESHVYPNTNRATPHANRTRNSHPTIFRMNWKFL